MAFGTTTMQGSYGTPVGGAGGGGGFSYYPDGAGNYLIIDQSGKIVGMLPTGGGRGPSAPQASTGQGGGQNMGGVDIPPASGFDPAAQWYQYSFPNTPTPTPTPTPGYSVTPFSQANLAPPGGGSWQQYYQTQYGPGAMPVSLDLTGNQFQGQPVSPGEFGALGLTGGQAMPDATATPSPFNYDPNNVYAGQYSAPGSVYGGGAPQNAQSPYGYSPPPGVFGYVPPIGTPGFLQGPTAIPETFDAQGYPIAQAAGIGPNTGYAMNYAGNYDPGLAAGYGGAWEGFGSGSPSGQAGYTVMTGGGGFVPPYRLRFL